MYEIEFTSEALGDLKSLRKFERQEIIAGIEIQLKHEPTVETRNRKKLRPNAIAGWELRIGRFRVLYNVEAQVFVVSIEAVGFKVGNVLFVRGEKREL
jgi:mRNA-degrading endonuclease RelE of RelBE toxin-antitoxin system